MATIQDTVKQDAAKIEAEAKTGFAAFLAKSFSGKVLLIAVGVAFLAGVLVHLI